jgi:hypothetical protein
MVLPVKLVLKFLGTLTFITGAIVSFSPPLIEPRLAQLAIRMEKRIAKIFI